MTASGSQPISNNRTKQAFTIIEVIMFVAITGLMLAGALMGAGTVISRQRYNDSVQDFTEFLRRTYSSALAIENSRTDPLLSKVLCSTQSPVDQIDPATTETVSNKELKLGLPGRSDCAYYGKLITFGEEDQTTVHTYDLIGRVYETNFDNPKELVDENLAKTIQPEPLQIFPDSTGTNCSIAPSRHQAYNFQWGAFAESTAKNQPFKGTIAIIRSPETGQIQTLYHETPLEIQTTLKEHQSSNPTACQAGLKDTYVKASFSQMLPGFKRTDLNICLNSSDRMSLGGKRRNLHISEFASNPSAIELRPKDSEANLCQE